MTKKKPIKKAAKKNTRTPTRSRGAAPRARAAIAPVVSRQSREPERRYVFRGNVAAFSGQLYRPEHIAMGAAGSCLSVAGGVSQSSTGLLTYGNGLVTIASTSTAAEGRVENLDRAKAWTDGRDKIREDSLPTITRAGATVTGLVVRRSRTLEIRTVSAALEAQSPRTGLEPGIVLASPVLDGLAVDGFAIAVEFNTTFFQRHDTQSKLLAAAATLRKSAPGMPGFFQKNGVVYATIVKSMAWVDRKPDKAEIVGNTITVADLGVFYIGEILITGSSRRLTMFRAELGSPDGGGGGGVDIDINGGWAP